MLSESYSVVLRHVACFCLKFTLNKQLYRRLGLPFGLCVGWRRWFAFCLFESPSHNFSLVSFCVCLPWCCTHAKHKAFIFLCAFILCFFFLLSPTWAFPFQSLSVCVCPFRLLINLLRLLSWCGLLSGVILCSN